MSFDDGFPIYWPKGYRGFTLTNYVISQITGGDTVFFRSEQVRHVVHGVVFCEVEVNLRLNPSLRSPEAFEKLVVLPDAEFRIVTVSGHAVAEWSMVYERQCANFRVRRDPDDEDDGINDVGQI